MQHIYLVRHGETTYNETGLVQDGSPRLTDRGHKQANRVAERLQHLDFSNLVVSDYERTKETAQPVAELTGVAPVYSELFREIRRPSAFFHTERKREGFQAYLQAEYAHFVDDPAWRHSDEENFTDSNQRARAALEYLSQLTGDTVVISHGHFIRMLTAMVACNGELDGPTWQKMYKSFKAVNTGITTFTYDAGSDHWQILTFNDHAHFAE